MKLKTLILGSAFACAMAATAFAATPPPTGHTLAIDQGIYAKDFVAYNIISPAKNAAIDDVVAITNGRDLNSNDSLAIGIGHDPTWQMASKDTIVDSFKVHQGDSGTSFGGDMILAAALGYEDLSAASAAIGHAPLELANAYHINKVGAGMLGVGTARTPLGFLTS